MPRPPGSKNKSTLAREAAERLRQSSLLPGEPFSETATRVTAAVAETAPLPSVRAPAEQNFIEYVAPNESRWRIEQGKALLAAFALDPADLSKWHGALAAEPNVWHIL